MMTARATTPEGPAAEWVAIDALTPWADNPRINDAAVSEVAESIKRFGWGSPILARRTDGEVIAGHTRLKAARVLGLDRVPVRWLDLDPVDAHLLALADNKLNERATWDDEGLADVLRELEAGGALLDGLGWDSEAIDALLREPVAMPEPSDDAPPVDEEGEPESRPGEVYHLGPHRLLCGDCRDAGVWERLLDGERVNVAFTSPPYASQRKYDESSGFKPIPPDEYVDWFEAVQANVRAHLADDGSWFVNIKEHAEDGQRHLYVKDLTIAHVRQWGWRFVDELAWVRAGVPGGWPNRFKNGWEPVFHFSGDAVKFRPESVSHATAHAFDYSPNNGKSVSGSGLLGKEHAAMFRDGLARPSNVLEVGSGGAKVTGEHSAEFPVALPSFFVRAFSDEGDIILDPFMGSGTTLIAAAKHGRRGFGMEISPRYCDVIRRRWGTYAREAGIDPGEGAL